MTCHPQRFPEFVERIDWGSIHTPSSTRLGIYTHAVLNALLSLSNRLIGDLYTSRPQRSPEFIEWIDWGSIQSLFLIPRSLHLEIWIVFYVNFSSSRSDGVSESHCIFSINDNKIRHLPIQTIPSSLLFLSITGTL